MNPIRSTFYASAVSIGIALSTVPVMAAESASGGITASELAARVNAQRQAGSSLVRMRMEVKGGSVLQIQAKERHAGDGGEVVYQVLFPKERKGEAILLRRSGRSVSGTHFVPPDKVSSVGVAQMGEPFLGSDLAYEDVSENFFGWDQQSLNGTEEVNGVPCQILESKPGKGDRSIYGSVRSWIDTRRMVPLRVEKYSSSGKLLRRIDTTRVVADKGRHIPANLTIRGPGGGSATEIDGSRIKYGVTFDDREFTPEGLKQLSAPRGEPAD